MSAWVSVRTSASGSVWAPTATRVAPLASVKSVSAQIVDTSTSMSPGNSKKSNAHWSRCSTCADSPGPMQIAWVRCSWKVVFCGQSTRSVTSRTRSWATISTELGDRASRAPGRRVHDPSKPSRPGRVAARCGASSAATRSHSSSGASRSMITAPSARMHLGDLVGGGGRVEAGQVTRHVDIVARLRCGLRREAPHRQGWSAVSSQIPALSGSVGVQVSPSAASSAPVRVPVSTTSSRRSVHRTR